jgi:hypothetical protein
MFVHSNKLREILPIKPKGSADLDEGDPALPDPAVQSRYRNSEKVGCLLNVKEWIVTALLAPV